VPARAPSQNAHETISSAPQTKDLAANLARMRALVQRMQSNLPAVASGQSPLEYEFQLQIEMWQVLIDQMEQQVKAASAPAQ
jgi:soluble cytochrome b562